MTDPKLPPLPYLSGKNTKSDQNKLQGYGEACYRAGQSSAEPMTHADAVDQVREWRGIPPFEPQCQECGCTLPQHFFHCGLKEIE